MRRGRRPVDKTSLRQKQILRARFREALQEGNEAAFIQALLDLGQTPGSAEYEHSMKLWRAYRRGEP